MTTRLLRVPASASLLPALRAACAGPAWAHACGPLAAAELRARDGTTHTLLGDLLLVSLGGLVSGPLVALVQVHEPLGVRLVAGELLEAVTAAPVDACLTGQDGAVRPSSEAPPARGSASRLPPPPGAASEPTFASAIEASAERPSSPTLFHTGSAGLAQPIPARPTRPQVDEEEGPTPEPGDRVEHFAFGSCDVLKSDGERLHLRLGRNGSIKEIALEMLRVSELPADGGPGRRFKLERRI